MGVVSMRILSMDMIMIVVMIVIMVVVMVMMMVVVPYCFKSAHPRAERVTQFAITDV